jgi:hypothetical protein
MDHLFHGMLSGGMKLAYSKPPYFFERRNLKLFEKRAIGSQDSSVCRQKEGNSKHLFSFGWFRIGRQDE